ncbi:MAG TPA: hypothetical protein VFJ01_07190 [Oleiagrimonas sp.]|nr:hypothetical protein [Oleiagrimonas sp.]
MADHHTDPTHAASGSVGESTERFKQATSDATGHTREAAGHVASRVEHGMHRGADKLAGTAERSREALHKAKDHADNWKHKACDHIRDKPTQSVVMAAAAGWLLGWALHRRH